MNACQVVVAIAPEVYSTSVKEVIQAIKQVKGYTGFRLTYTDSLSGITTITSSQEHRGVKRKKVQFQCQSEDKEDVVPRAPDACEVPPVGCLRFARRVGGWVARECVPGASELPPVELVRSPAAVAMDAHSQLPDCEL